MRRSSRLLLPLLLPLTLGRLRAAGLDPSLQAFVETVIAARERHADPAAAVQPEAVQDAIRAYLKAFGDPATRYLSPREWEELERSARGHFQGFGLLLVREGERFLVERIYPDSPAERAGLEAGDEIVGVNGRSRLPDHLSELRALLQEVPTGARVRIRRGNRSLDLELHPGTVELPSLETAWLEDSVFYLRLRSFTQRGGQEVEEVLQRERRIRSLILDLRGNGGGVLDTAVEIHGLLAGPGPVTWILDREGNRSTRRSQLRPLTSSPPAIVLVDRNTASAAEVLAASLQRRGSLLVGESTYGKGSIQEVTPLADGGAAVLTVAHYEIAPGKLLPATGLVPDREFGPGPGGEIPFPPDPGQDVLLQASLDILLGRREYASQRRTD